MRQEIEKILENQVRPALLKDGGNIEILQYDDETKLLRLRLMGQCSTCPQATNTGDHIVKATLKKALPEIKDIIVESGLSEEMLNLAKKYLGGN